MRKMKGAATKVLNFNKVYMKIHRRSGLLIENDKIRMYSFDKIKMYK